MSLPSFEIEDEPPLHHVRCPDVPDVMIIAGPNGVGKSTLLETIFGYSGDEFEGDTDVAYFGPHRSPANQTIARSSLIQMDERTSREMMAFHSARHRRNRLRDIIGSSIPGQVERNNPRIEPDFLPYYEVKRRMAQLAERKSQILTREYDENGEVPSGFFPDLGEHFRDAVDRVLPGLRFEEIDASNNQFRLLFTNRDGEEVTFDDLSSGEKDLIALVFLAIEHELQTALQEKGLIEETREGDLLVLIDGPESYLHPRLQLNLIEYVRDFVETAGSTQFIICTHSRTFISAASLDELFFLMYPDRVDGNQLIQADSLPTDRLDELTEDLGHVALSSGKQILLVEGKTDREIIQLLWPSLEDSFDLIPMSGKDPIVSSILNEIIPELAEAGVSVFGVVDGDRDLDLSDEVEGRVHRLPVATIENLLLEPDPLYEALEVMVGVTDLENEGLEGPNDVEVLIEDIVSDATFIAEEVEARWNEGANPVFVSLQGYRDSACTDVENYAKEVAEERMNRAPSPGDVEQEVRDLIQDEEFGALSGKRITHELSTVFGLNRDRLLRLTAKSIDDPATILPRETASFFQDLVDREPIEQPGTPFQPPAPAAE